ncbi:YggU family protein [Candidatus Sumerlaeota bacterium]|nr:YggU family protein [Candidatus Sumerlaeota bacterium]
MSLEPIEATEQGVRLRVHMQPGAKRSQWQGLHGGALKLQIQAPPVEGKANKAAIAFIAKSLGVARGNVELTAGQTSREKTFAVSGVDLKTAREILISRG